MEPVNHIISKAEVVSLLMYLFVKLLGQLSDKVSWCDFVCYLCAYECVDGMKNNSCIVTLFSPKVPSS